MSAVNSISGQLEPAVSTVLTTTSQTDVFTADSSYLQTIEQVWVVNADTSNDIFVTLEWNDGSTDYKYFNGTIPSKTTAEFTPKFVLSSKSATQKLKATADTGNQITVTVIASGSLSQQGAGY